MASTPGLTSLHHTPQPPNCAPSSTSLTPPSSGPSCPPLSLLPQQQGQQIKCCKTQSLPIPSSLHHLCVPCAQGYISAIGLPTLQLGASPPTPLSLFMYLPHGSYMSGSHMVEDNKHEF